MFGPGSVFELESFNKRMMEGESTLAVHWSNVMEAQANFEIEVLHQLSKSLAKIVPDVNEVYLSHELSGDQSWSSIVIDKRGLPDQYFTQLEQLEEEFKDELRAFWWVETDGILFTFQPDGHVIAEWRGREVDLS